MSLSPAQAQAIAVNRLGLGARADEALPANPRDWLLRQFDRFEVRPAAFAALPAPGSRARFYLDELAAAQSLRGTTAALPPGAIDPVARDQAALLNARSPEQREALNAELRDSYRAGVNARMASALATEAPFIERLAAFWSNHFALSIEKPQVGIYAAFYEAEAIRPHVLGRFEDMLVAVERHPAMLYFLDQYRSAGPNSPVAQRAAQRQPNQPIGLNENLAREILELHTLGVRTGYEQADVTEFARALTGWSIGGIGPIGKGDAGVPGEFVFRSRIHEPGDRTIIGKRYPAGGEGQARAVLHDLAVAPATARHIATKLARHLVADDPPPALVDRMIAAFVDSAGDLPSVYRVLIDAPEAWDARQAKFKTPWDWAVSALRGIGRRDLGKVDAASTMIQLGQQIWRSGSPAGYDDVAAAWAAPDALLRRVEMAQRFATAAGGAVDARSLARRLLPGQLSAATAAGLAQADSGATALALLLVSPEFQRR